MERKRDLLKIAWLPALISLLVAACAPAATPGPAPKAVASPKAQAAETPQAKSAPAATPKPAADQPRYGGSLVLPANTDVAHLDIHDQAAIAAFSPLGTVYNGLAQYDQQNKVIPDLAESWEVSSEGTAYTFRLRKGVKWHDGKPFSSADAKFSLDRVLRSKDLNFTLGAADKIEAVDQDTLKVSLKYRQPSFLPIMAHGRTLIGPKHIIDSKGDLKRDAIGTGPFKLKEYVAGTSWKMEKNKEYFIKERPYLDVVTFFIIRDFATRFAAFRTGRLQIYGHPPIYGELTPSHIDTLKRELPQAVINRYETMRLYGFLPNWNRAPWSDVRVRRAVFLALDREKGIEAVSEGQGTPAVSVFYGEWQLPKEELAKMPGFRKPKDEDIAEAKRLLTEAGYPQGFKSSAFVRAGIPLTEKVGTFMSDQLAKIGIELSLRIMEYSIWFDARAKGNYDTLVNEFSLPLADPDTAVKYITKRGGVFISVDDDKILDMMDKQSRAGNEAERKQIVYDIQRRVAEVVPHIGIGWEYSYIAFWPQVRSYTATSSVYAHNKLEEIWLAK